MNSSTGSCVQFETHDKHPMTPSNITFLKAPSAPVVQRYAHHKFSEKIETEPPRTLDEVFEMP